MEDIRWKQRFQHFCNAFRHLKNAKDLQSERDFSELELQGAIKAFEVTQELSWKVMKDFLESEGTRDLFGSKTAVRESFNVGLITDAEVWNDMIKSRNLTSHLYDYDNSEILKILKIIFEDYIPVFESFEVKMKTLL